MKDLIKKFIKMNKVKKIIIIVIMILLAFCIFTTVTKYIPKHVTSTAIMKNIEASSELTTAKITYRGLHKYEDQGVWVINKGDFTMVYTAIIRTGFNIDEMNIKVNNFTKKVTVKIPKAKILDVNIDEGSMEFYDSKFTLFNLDVKSDVTKAINEAKEDAKKNVLNDVDLEFANQQSEILVRGLIQKSTPRDYEIVVSFK